MKVNINQSSCIECGTCKAVCPQVFELNEEGKAYIIKDANLEDNKDCIENAASMCPAGAIIVEG